MDEIQNQPDEQKQIDEDESDVGSQDELSELEDFFDGVESSMSLVISRLEPSEYKGVLEEIDIEPNQNPVNLNYLIRKWGGHKLLLRLRKKRGQNGAGQWVAHRAISLYSYPPMRFGKRLSRNEQLHGEMFADRETPKPDNPMSSMMEMANFMTQMRQGEMTALSAMLGQLAPAQQPVAQPAVDPFNQATQLLGLLSQFTALQQPQPQPQVGEDDQVIGLLGKLAESFGQATRPTGPPPKLLDGAGAQPQSGNQPTTPQSVVSNLRSGFLKLDPSGQQQVLNDIFTQLRQAGGDELLLSSLEEMGIIDSDESENEFAENADYENPGGKPRPDERDDPSDR